MQRQRIIPVTPIDSPNDAGDLQSSNEDGDGLCHLKVGGVTPFTATDFPGRLATVVFVQGCPWRCGYCHNPHLQPRTRHSPHAWQQVLDLLQRRQGLIDAVVFSGGEPTIDPALPQAIEQVRAMEYEVGLHSAGIYPDKLAAILPQIDWIGLDIKAPFDAYERITGIAGSGEQARACLDAVLTSGVAHEVRTTAHPDLLKEEEILDTAWMLSQAGVRNYALQVFRKQGCGNVELNAATMANYPSAPLVRHLGSLFPQFTLRRD